MTNHAEAIPSLSHEIRWSWSKALWLWGMGLGWLVGGVSTFSATSVALYALLTAWTLCVGHSVGLHRGVIHGAFSMSKTTERIFVYLATIVGLGGPLTLYRAHETRDHWQNQPACPDYYAYGHGLGQDFLWYLHMVHVPRSPGFVPQIPQSRLRDPVYRGLERTWMLQQIPIAWGLYAIFGLPGVVWGVCARVTTSLLGHWIVNYVAHTHGYRWFDIAGSGEQGGNSVLFGMLSMGEGWHNNHHAYPRSARLGMAWWELDPGWWAVRVLAACGVIWDVHHHDNTAPKPEVTVRVVPPRTARGTT